MLLTPHWTLAAADIEGGNWEDGFKGKVLASGVLSMTPRTRGCIWSIEGRLQTKCWLIGRKKVKFDLFPRIGKSATGSGVRAPSDFAALLPRKPDSPATAVFYSPSSHRLIIDLNTSSPFQPKNSPFTAWSCLPSSPLRLLRLPDNWPQYPPFHLSFAKKLSNTSSDIPHQCLYIYDRVFCPNSYHILFCFWRTKFYRPKFLSKDHVLV